MRKESLMIEKNDKIYANLREWSLLTDIPVCDGLFQNKTSGDASSQEKSDKTPVNQPSHPALQGISENLFKLLWDIMCYLYSSANIRIKRLGISPRVYEQAKLEGVEKKLFVESSAGQYKYLIPERKPFDAFDMSDPFNAGELREHSFYEHWWAHIIKKNPAYKTVQIEAPIGNSGSTADGITIEHNGTRIAWEITLSTKNVLSNAAKYANTDIAQINFLCRNYKLRDAVKADCREGRLDSNLLARLDYMHFSELLKCQQKLYRY